jgi:cytochrome c oxidase subunit 1
MPRRIPDYPDIYAFWNKVASFGSLLSVIGIMVFMVMLFQVIMSRKKLRVYHSPFIK